jgi:uncharacterized protein (TIGR02145 family)
MIKLMLVVFLLVNITTYSQVSINKDGSTADASAMLDVKATDAGFLPPRLTELQRIQMDNPADGLVIFNTTTNCLNFYYAGNWIEECGTPVIEVPTVYNPSTGKTWMDRNLGASQVATSSYDAASYGDLYQWGRADEGHEGRYSWVTSTNATTAVPNAGNSWDGLFISEGNSPNDWLTPQDNALWQGVNGTNNPCPAAFRLPTKAEWDAEVATWSSENTTGAFASLLKLSAAGYRRRDAPQILGDVGYRGYYWSSNTYSTSAYVLQILEDAAGTGIYFRAQGYSVRCIRDY